MISIARKPGPNPRRLTAIAAVFAAVSVAGCAGSVTSPGTPTAAAAHTPTASSSQAPPATNSPSTAGGSAKASAGSSGTASGNESPSTSKPADYQPSKVVSSSPSSTVLTSPDTVTKVADFYKAELPKSGWHVTSSTIGAYSATFTATRGNEGANVSIYHTGSGSGISINTHPT